MNKFNGAAILVLLTLGLTTGLSAKYDIKEIERSVAYHSGRLKSSNTAVRLSAVRNLGKIPHKLAVYPLIKALNDKNVMIRIRVIRALANLNYIQAVKPIIRRLKVEKEDYVIREALIALGKLKDERARTVLKRYLTHNNLGIRLQAKKSLAMLDQGDSIFKRR
ncbi:MAG: HEAT repeat domain-containing protein [Spirochaetota bacterium]|nr:HEAT repeat domain-containing protein [Spirochaetota bacterium]